jgi:hypothetical protein
VSLGVSTTGSTVVAGASTVVVAGASWIVVGEASTTFAAGFTVVVATSAVVSSLSLLSLVLPLLLTELWIVVAA